MDLFKAYAVCTNSYNIISSPNLNNNKLSNNNLSNNNLSNNNSSNNNLSNNKLSNNYNCEIFSSLEDINNHLIKKSPIDFYILEIYGKDKKLSLSKIKLKLIYK